MKKTLTLITGAYLVGSVSSSAAITLVAGWDAFSSINNVAATQVAPETTATLTSGATAGGWDDWNNSTLGASDDGTFGNLGIGVASASTNIGTGSNQGTNLSLNRITRGGFLTFTITNDSTVNREFAGFYFDVIRRFEDTATDWELTFGGAISGSLVTAAIAQNNTTGMKGASPAQRDRFVDLTGLPDKVWEAGQNAVFTLSFIGSSGTLNGGGQEVLIDNIGITANVVPEPSSLTLIGLGFCGLLLRRRK